MEKTCRVIWAGEGDDTRVPGNGQVLNKWECL